MNEDAGRHRGRGRRHHWRGGRRGRDVVYVESAPLVLYDFDYCPPGFYRDEWGNCRPIRPGEAGGLSAAADLGMLALEKNWPMVDPKKRTMSQAMADSLVRAASKAWPAGNVVAVFDLIALVVGSAILSSSVKDDPNKAIGVRAAAALDRTWTVLAKRSGYAGQDPIAVQKLPPSSPDVRGALPILEIVIVVVAIAAVAGVYAWAIWKAAEIIDRQLARGAEEDELIRLHSEWQKIVDRHVANPDLPWTPQELQILKALEDAQEGIRKDIAPPPPTPPVKPLDLTLLAAFGLAAAGGYFIFLRKPKT